MPRGRTAVGLISPARRRIIAEACTDDNAALIIRPIPESVRYDTRIDSGIRNRHGYKKVFSVFVTPETVSEASARWEAAKSEMESVFMTYHAAAEERKREAERKAALRAEWLQNAKDSISLNTVMGDFNGCQTLTIKDTLDAFGQRVSCFAIINTEQSTYYNRGRECVAYITEVTQGRNRPIPLHATRRYESISDAVEKLVSDYKEAAAQWLLKEHERKAAENGVTLAWQ